MRDLRVTSNSPGCKSIFRLSVTHLYWFCQKTNFVTQKLSHSVLTLKENVIWIPKEAKEQEAVKQNRSQDVKVWTQDGYILRLWLSQCQEAHSWSTSGVSAFQGQTTCPINCWCICSWFLRKSLRQNCPWTSKKEACCLRTIRLLRSGRSSLECNTDSSMSWFQILKLSCKRAWAFPDWEPSESWRLWARCALNCEKVFHSKIQGLVFETADSGTRSWPKGVTGWASTPCLSSKLTAMAPSVPQWNRQHKDLNQGSIMHWSHFTKPLFPLLFRISTVLFATPSIYFSILFPFLYVHTTRITSTSGSRGPWRPSPPWPQICFQIMQFSGNFKGNPLFWANFRLRAQLGSKLCWVPLTKILDPRLSHQKEQG